MLYLHGMGHFHPDNIISNQFLVDLDIGTSHEWIEERVGIQNRRTVLALEYIRETKNVDFRAAYEARQYKNSQMAALAARQALERAGLKTKDIGMVVAGSSSPDNIAPAESSAVAEELGIEVPCIDMNSACSSFGMQINFLSKMAPETLPAYVLVVDSETLTKSVNYADRSVAVLFGDGSTAAVVSTTNLPNSPFAAVMSLPYHIYVLATTGMNPDKAVPIQCATALVLLMTVFALNLIAFYIRQKSSKRPA